MEVLDKVLYELMEYVQAGIYGTVKKESGMGYHSVGLEIIGNWMNV